MKTSSWFPLALATVVVGGVGLTARQAPATPTYTKDVAPILYKNCTSCHRPGEIGPMSLLSYADARPHARNMAAQVTAGTMPPWHADPSVGRFENARSLSTADRDVIVRWANGGAPEGNRADLPAAPVY